MAELVLFHHAHGLTSGCLAFADELRAAGHTVHAPDLYDGSTFASLDDGLAYVRQIGFEAFAERGVAAVESLPAGLVYVGMSLGAMPAQQLAQTRAGAAGAVLLHAALPAAEFGGWPEGVPLQIHLMADDAFALEGDLDAARELDETVEKAELFLYPGDRHLFTDSSLADYDEAAAALVRERVLSILDRPA